eukprot:1568281-Pleurochrysis_carterae.AAC.1
MMLPLCPWRWRRLPRPPCSLRDALAEVATETLAPSAVQPDASAVSMEVETPAPAAVQPDTPAE